MNWPQYRAFIALQRNECSHIQVELKLKLFCKCTATAMARYLVSSAVAAASLGAVAILILQYCLVRPKLKLGHGRIDLAGEMNGLEELIRPFRLLVDDHLSNACRINLHHLRCLPFKIDRTLSAGVLITKLSE